MPARAISRRAARVARSPADVAVLIAQLKAAQAAALVSDARLRDAATASLAHIAAASAAAEKRLADVQAAADFRLAVVTYDLDVARSRIGVRAILEASFLALRRPRSDAAARSGGGKAAMAQIVSELLPAKAGVASTCPGLVAYLSVAAADNALGEEQVLRAANELYASLSTLAHSTHVAGANSLPADVFDGWGRETLVAYAAIVTFAGRRLSFYVRGGGVDTVKLRAIKGCSVTAAAVREAALLE